MPIGTMLFYNPRKTNSEGKVPYSFWIAQICASWLGWNFQEKIDKFVPWKESLVIPQPTTEKPDDGESGMTFFHSLPTSLWTHYLNAKTFFRGSPLLVPKMRN